jgi:hypothetical protein
MMLGLLLASPIAFACSPPSMEQENHAGMHHTKMHAMSQEERQRMLDEKLAAIDADKNGSISRAEFDEHHRMMHEEHEQQKAEAQQDAKAAEAHEHEH